MDQAKIYIQKLDKYLSQYPQFKSIERKVGVNKVTLVISLMTVGALMLAFNILAGLLSNLVGLLYPAYKSFKAIENANQPNHANAHDKQQWLTYWITFALFSTLENISSSVISWIPFYFLLKSLALVYLFSPFTNGASLVYSKLIRPLILQAEAGAHKVVDNVKKNISNEMDKFEKNIHSTSSTSSAFKSALDKATSATSSTSGNISPHSSSLSASSENTAGKVY